MFLARIIALPRYCGAKTHDCFHRFKSHVTVLRAETALALGALVHWWALSPLGGRECLDGECVHPTGQLLNRNMKIKLLILFVTKF